MPLATVLAELIDGSSVGGAVFDLGSATDDMTRIVTGQLDAYLDVGTRMIEEIPAVRSELSGLAEARSSNSPYDLAAAALCVREAGGVVTDAYGRSLEGKPDLDRVTSSRCHVSQPPTRSFMRN